MKFRKRLCFLAYAVTQPYRLFVSTLLTILFVAALPTISAAISSEDLVNDRNSVLAVLEPRHAATLTAQVSSIVTGVFKDMGEHFFENDSLVSLDAELFVLDVAKKTALLESAEINYQSALHLFQDKSISRIDLNKAQTDLAVARLDLVRAETELQYCTIKAPYDGRVKNVEVKEHEWIAKGKALLEIVDDRVLRAKALMPLALLPRLEIGADVKILIAQPQHIVTGRISHISPVIDSSSQTIEIFAEIINTDGKLKSGMTGLLILAAEM